MSDLAATNCGCGCDNGCDNGSGAAFFGGNSCSCILWIIVLMYFCGGNTYGNNGCGCGDNSCLLLILLLLCCGGNGFGCGC